MGRGIGVTERFRANTPEWMEPVFQFLSLPGDWRVIGLCLALLYLAAVWRSLRDPVHPADAPLCPDRTVVAIATVFGGLALVLVVESLVDAPRPPADLQAIERSGSGFPSGHTMAATVFVGALLVRFRETVGRKDALAGSLVVFLVALSRLALGVHYLVDVVGAIAIGGVFVSLVSVSLTESSLGTLVLAAGIATLAVVLTGGEFRPVLALLGSVGLFFGWQAVEHPRCRRPLERYIGRSGSAEGTNGG